VSLWQDKLFSSVKRHMETRMIRSMEEAWARKATHSKGLAPPPSVLERANDFILENV
jgi:hypothetical protein